VNKRLVGALAIVGLFVVYESSALAASKAGSGNNMIPMRVKGLATDPKTDQPIVLLEEIGGKRFLPIWINESAASAIAMEMSRITTPRPMTHDLIKNILAGLQVKVTKVVINDLRGGTFYALIFLEQNGSEVAVDSRPSDAIALALRVKSLILVSVDVIDKAGREMEPGEANQEI
jgi:bifunctional DNase/RNase